MFRSFSNYENDPIEGMFARLAEDTDPSKIDLGIGVYRDDTGQVPVMQAVRYAEMALLERRLPKSYLSPRGNPDYCKDTEQLVLGAKHPTLLAGRVHSIQTPGAGSALRVAAEFVHELAPDSRVWLSSPA
ncbi:MAG: aminotransferase class I/II-fold pyridoxal phosphate-dependent enzyme, partial [Gammaproteobacteria bacterium]|nr:aminotransferase class I/II-fold pyridoxal phosphate-dependent enzyme [Gammaproteobacteria bacterium]